MKVLVLASQKGGCGKTTLVASLAVAAHEAGEQVVVVDLDLQGSVTSWGRLRSAGGIVFRTVAPSDLNGWIEQTRQIPAVSLCVIDTPGLFGPQVDVALGHAQFALVPVRASVLDLWASVPTARRIAELGRNFGWVLNAASQIAHSRTKEAIAAFGANGPVGPVVLDRVVHRDAMASGLGVTELEPKGKAATEIRDLWNWTKQRMSPETIDA